MLVDSHCHLDMLSPVKETGSADGVLADARAEGVEHFLCVGVRLETFPSMVDICNAHSEVSMSVGVHPCASARDADDETLFRDYATWPRVVAIGETGLDYFREEADRNLQKRRFASQINLARELGKPVIVHTRNARKDTIDLLRQEGRGEVSGVIHCFTEDWATARAALDLGFSISLSGIVTFASAGELRDVARKVPADRLLVETDCPYLAPVPRRGKENRPAWVRHVAQCLADERGEAFEDLARQTTENYFRLFSQAERCAA
ncbi:MAG: TatD family hydrolase [Gammaproteobacteria bacterium]|jgi:TatD DNase family protein